MSAIPSSVVPRVQFHRPSRSGLLHLPPVTGPGPVDSRALLRGTREVLIQHGGEVYRLRHTRNDKLILTK